MSRVITTHARHDPAHCLCPGLFRALKRGERKYAKLDITYLHGSASLRFWGPEPLGADDLRILQAAVALAGPKGGRLGPDPKTPLGRTVRERLEIEDNRDGGRAETVAVRTTVGRLLSELGIDDGGRQREIAIASLDRLASVTVVVDQGPYHGTSHILSFATDTKTGEIMIGLNPVIARAIVGGRHTRIPMAEVRSLADGSDTVKLLHQRLCAIIGPGGGRHLSADTLSGYVWPEHGRATPDTRKRHRQRIRRAMAELDALPGWECREAGGGVWSVKRNKTLDPY